MALIECPECGVQVSSSAESCPKCGYPIAGAGPNQAHGGNVQTIEQTSKYLKIQQLLSILLIIASFFALGSGDVGAAVAGPALLVGVLWYIVVRCSIWWQHE